MGGNLELANAPDGRVIAYLHSRRGRSFILLMLLLMGWLLWHLARSARHLIAWRPG